MKRSAKNVRRYVPKSKQDYSQESIKDTTNNETNQLVKPSNETRKEIEDEKKKIQEVEENDMILSSPCREDNLVDTHDQQSDKQKTEPAIKKGIQMKLPPRKVSLTTAHPISPNNMNDVKSLQGTTEDKTHFPGIIDFVGDPNWVDPIKHLPIAKRKWSGCSPITHFQISEKVGEGTFG